MYIDKLIMNKYKDPENTQELMNTFLTLTNKVEIQSFIETVFPDWLVASTDKYTVDYPHLTDNWKRICLMNSVEPQKIIIVDELIFDPDHSLIQFFAEYMTRRGYVIRRKEELTGCDVCKHAMPSKLLWTQFKDKSLPIPKKWRSVCSECR